jgi:hypothetical protein
LLPPSEATTNSQCIEASYIKYFHEAVWKEWEVRVPNVGRLLSTFVGPIYNALWLSAGHHDVWPRVESLSKAVETYCDLRYSTQESPSHQGRIAAKDARRSGFKGGRGGLGGRTVSVPCKTTHRSSVSPGTATSTMRHTCS